MQMSEAFPDLAMQTDEVYWMGNDTEGYLASVRWSATGTHRGHGMYSKPTGRPVRLWGITQYKIVQGQIVENWTMFNELNLLMQLLG
jgi:predicted ester cyclase